MIAPERVRLTNNPSSAVDEARAAVGGDSSSQRRPVVYGATVNER